MKLLFDQNLSHRLVEQLADRYPGSAHVRLLHFDLASDREIWEYAKAHGYAIVSIACPWSCCSEHGGESRIAD